MVIVINSMIGGFSWVDLVWLVALTVPLQVSDYSQLSYYTWHKNSTEKYVKIDSANAPITFEEIVMVMIKSESMPNPSGQTASIIQIKLVR